MRRFHFAGIVLALCLAAPRPAHAQLGGLSFGLAGGLTTPRGIVKDWDYKAGPHVQALAELSLPALPVGFRAELAYDQLGAPVSGTSSFKVISGVVNATLGLPVPVIHPYAIAGAGYYRQDPGAAGDRQGKLGFNGGVGVQLKLPSFPRLFAEARYHTVSYNLRLIPSGERAETVKLIPLSVGIIF